MSFQIFLHKGLGKRLFQYASAKGLAQKYNLNFSIFAIDYNYEHNNNNYDWFLYKIITAGMNIIQIPRQVVTDSNFTKDYPYITLWKQPENEDIGYYELSIEEIKNKVLYGHFQSEKYFENITKELQDQFREPNLITNELNEYMKYLDVNKTYCIIHIRVKDKVNNIIKFVHYNKYYERAIEEVCKKNPLTHFLILSELQHEVDMFYPSLCKDILKDKEFSFVPRTSRQLDLFDFYLLTRIPIIISSSSTFAWWGAWLNRLPNKQVYLPSKFNNNSVNNYIDMKGAVRIEVE